LELPLYSSRCASILLSVKSERRRVSIVPNTQGKDPQMKHVSPFPDV